MPVKFQDNMAVRGTATRDWTNFRGTGLRKTTFFKYNSTYGSSAYIHMKTNIPSNHRAWYMIEALGYNYGLGKDLYSFWGFRPNLISSNVKGANSSRTDALLPQSTNLNGIYYSSDSYVVIYAYSSSFYYIGFALNLYAATDPEQSESDPSRYYIPDVQIIASSLNQNAGAFY